MKYISVGGLGGSGTRVVADLLQKAGVYIGNDLIESLDNLHFTRLLKNPDFYYQSNRAERVSRINLLLKISRREKLSSSETAFYKHAAKDNIRFCPFEETRINKSLAAPLLRKKTALCGWKEPNTHIYCEELMNEMKDMNYIHVIRNGLDMAFSSNKQQLSIWGKLFDIEDHGEKAQLDYWIESTKRILALKDAFRDRILIVKYDQLIDDPQRRAPEILDWLDLSIAKGQMNEWIKNLTIPPSKYQPEQLRLFDPEQLDFIKSMGFVIKS